RDELVELGIFESSKRGKQLSNGFPVEQTLIRPKNATTLLETVRKLTTIVQASDWGGEREGAGRRQKWACPKDPTHNVITRHICNDCGEDAELVDVTCFQDETWSGEAGISSSPLS